MRIVRSCLAFLISATLLTAICLAEAPDRIGTIDSSKVVPLPSQVQRLAKPEFDLGRVDGSLQLSQVRIFTTPSPSQVAALKQLLEDLQDPKSPYFHKWLTPAQYADRFGLSHNDVQKISVWLKSQGFTIVRVANGRNWIVFSGTASQIESAFHTEIHRYNVNGEMHFANATPPSVPAALSSIATGFMGLDDFRPKPRAKKALPRDRTARPGYSDANTGRGDFLAPNDIATMYDLGPLYTAGFDGTGEKMVIVGQTDVYLADLNDFRSGFGLTAISGCSVDGNGVITATSCNTANFQYVLDGTTDPGVSTGDLTEADLDLEWSAATARGAKIIFYNSANVFTSLLDAIDNKVAPVMSMSYGQCEWFLGGGILTSTGPGSLEIGMMQASTNGITILNSSGDSGAAECDPPPSFEPPDTNDIASWGLAVSYPASSPEVTAVGGTAVPYPSGFSATLWGTNNTTNDGGTLVSYPGETAWNDDEELPLVPGLGGTALSWQESYAIVQSGGGVSNCALQNDPSDTLCVSGFPVPSWQSGISFPAGTAPATAGRYTPDVSLLASPNFPGYVYCTPLEELATGITDDTSTTSSCAGGIAGAVNGVLTGTPPNQTYVVSPSVVGGTSASSPVFAGMVVMLNQYLNGANSPGLGPINSTLYKLAATPANLAFHQVTTGDNMVYCSGDTPNPNFEINSAYLCPGATNSTGLFGWSASNADTGGTGYNLVTGLGSVDADNLFKAWQASLGGFTMSPAPGSLTAVAGHAATGTSTITVADVGSFSGSVTFTCQGPPVGVTCAFNPTSSATTTVLTITTLANTATGASIPITVSATGGGVTETTTVDLTVTATDQTYILAAHTPTVEVTPGEAGNFTIGISSTTNGLALPQYQLSFTCSESLAAAAPLLASGSTCTVSPSVPTAITTTGTFPVSLMVTTVAATGQLRTPFGNSRGIFYAALLPGMLGIFLTAGSRKRSIRGIRFLSLFLVLGFSTLWLGSCSSSGGSTHNPGTPAGSYPVVVNATTGGANPVTSSVTVTLAVQ
jgi:subtilase family serine protease